MTDTTVPVLAAYEHFGACPDCGRHDGYINIGRSHWFYCREHKTRWIAGHNLFDSWKHETKDEQEAIYEALEFGTFRYVGPDAEGYYAHLAERAEGTPS